MALVLQRLVLLAIVSSLQLVHLVNFRLPVGNVLWRLNRLNSKNKVLESFVPPLPSYRSTGEQHWLLSGYYFSGGDTALTRDSIVASLPAVLANKTHSYCRVKLQLRRDDRKYERKYIRWILVTSKQLLGGLYDAQNWSCKFGAGSGICTVW